MGNPPSVPVGVSASPQKIKQTSWHKVQTKGLLTPLSFKRSLRTELTGATRKTTKFSPLCCRGLKSALCQEGGREPSDCRNMYPGCFMPVLRWSPAGPRQKTTKTQTPQTVAWGEENRPTDDTLEQNGALLLRALWNTRTTAHGLNSPTEHEPKDPSHTTTTNTAAHSLLYEAKETACMIPS